MKGLLITLAVLLGIGFLFLSFKKKGKPPERSRSSAQPNPYKDLKRLAYASTCFSFLPVARIHLIRLKRKGGSPKSIFTNTWHEKPALVYRFIHTKSPGSSRLL